MGLAWQSLIQYLICETKSSFQNHDENTLFWNLVDRYPLKQSVKAVSYGVQWISKNLRDLFYITSFLDFAYAEYRMRDFPLDKWRKKLFVKLKWFPFQSFFEDISILCAETAKNRREH